MLSTAIGVQFNVNDLDANYEVVGTSDNYSFQYNLGKGSDIADFEGEAIQKVISLEGNYGLFDVRVFAVSDIGVRSEFVESGIAISSPLFEDTFTFANLRVENLPENPNVGAFNTYEPQFPGDKLEVESEYVNRNVEIAWSLVPPAGHVKEGQALSSELLRDTFFDKFEIILENGTGAQVIDANVLASSPGLQDSLLTADVTGLLNQYRDFSLTLNELVFDDIGLDRTFGVKIISHDSFGRTATGVLTGINYEPQAEGLSYALRGSDMSFSWFSNDTDFSGINIKSLAIPSDKTLIYPTDLQANIDHYYQLSAASRWNFGRGEYRSGDMVFYEGLVYQSKTGINLQLIEDTGRSNVSPKNTDLWESMGEKVEHYVEDLEIFENTASTYQVWGYSYYYSFQPKDGYGAVEVLNLTDDGLIEGGNLRAFTSEVKIGNLRFRERKDDLVFNWDVLDQDGNLVDLEQYRFALSSVDVPSILGVSGSLFDSHTKLFLTGITEGNTSKISSVDELGNRKIVYDLPNTKVFDTYEFTREINNQIYGTGGFLSNFEIFDTGTTYASGDHVAQDGQTIYTAKDENSGYAPQVSGYNPTIRPTYDVWATDTTYPVNDVVEYIGDLYVLLAEFGPDSDDVLGVFNSRSNYKVGDLVIGPDIRILPYFYDEAYIPGDVVIYNQTIYRALKSQTKLEDYAPDLHKSYWQVLSIFEDIPCAIYRAKNGLTVDAPFSINNNGEFGDEYIDNAYYYICFSENKWARAPMIPFIRVASGQVGDKDVDENYYYVCLGGNNWGGILLTDSTRTVAGNEQPLDTVIETHFVHVYAGTRWKKFIVSHWNYNGYTPLMDVNNWERQTPITSNRFEKYISAYPLLLNDWSSSENYDTRNFVLYRNDLWSGVQGSGPIYGSAREPIEGSEYWTNTGVGGVDFTTNHVAGDLVYHNNSVYQALANNPTGGPIIASLNSGDSIYSNYQDSQWLPFWELNTEYDGFIYGHVGIPESGKRSVGIEIGIVNNTGGILNSQRLIGINQEPSILANGFRVDSLSETTKIKFNFNYAFSTQEKTTKVHLYRSETPDFEITGADGFPYSDANAKLQGSVSMNAGSNALIGKRTLFTNELQSGDYIGVGENRFFVDSIVDDLHLITTSNNVDAFAGKTVYKNPDSPLVNITLGAADATFGDNITQIVDSPPILKLDGIDKITGYYYKILPFDDFGSGDLFGVNNNKIPLEQCLVYPKNYSNKNPNGLPGPVYRTAADDIPGTVVDLSGNTAFQNYFLNWIHPSGNIQDRDQIPNDISHYEVWMSEDDKLELGSLNIFLKDEKSTTQPIDFSNSSGYRRIETDISGTGPIPIERQDPASGITNASRIFNVQSNGPEIETSYFGSTNDTRYFWVRAVDFAGNKGPFTGAANLTGAEIEGLGLTLGQASATDIDDFELNMTEIFGNTIALAPNSNPFTTNGQAISWDNHVLYYQGEGYYIDGELTGVGLGYPGVDGRYLWWDNHGNYDQLDAQDRADIESGLGLSNVVYSGYYRTSLTHPGGSSGVAGDPDFDDGDFIVGKIRGYPNNVSITPVFHAFANALIGTANIAEAAIVDAKINDLKADKITAGEIKGHEIMIGSQGGQYGSILTPGFTGYTNPVDGTVYSATGNGFVLSGDGTFEFRTEQGKLTLDNDGTLALEGRLRQSDGTSYDFIDLNANPSFFNYNEIKDPFDSRNSLFELESVDPIQIVASFRNSDIQDDEILFRMRALSTGSGLVDVFTYDDWRNRSDYEISGLSYDHTIVENFEIDGAIRHAKATFEPAGFDAIVNAYGADSVILYCSGQNNNYETTTTITRVIDGKVGQDGASSSYRGDWLENIDALTSTETITYVGKNSGDRNRGDIVKYDNGGFDKYWICKETHLVGSGDAFNTSFWEGFGATFTSVATQLLITEQSKVIDTIEIGDPGSGGKIISNGFSGGYDSTGNNQTENYDPAGFRIERTDQGIAIFDVGGQTIHDTPSYIRFSTVTRKLEIRGSVANNSSEENIDWINITASGALDPISTNDLNILDTEATFIGGGYNNEFGAQNLASSIVGGAKNSINGRYSFVGNGLKNTCGDNFSAIVGGYNNSMPKVDDANEGANFIGAGQSNSIDGGTNQAIICGSNNSIYYDLS